MRQTRPAARLAGLALTVLLLGCGGGGTGPSSNDDPPAGGQPAGGQQPGGTNGNEVSVTVRNNLFAPVAASVAVGATVRWSWDACSNEDDGYGGRTCVEHNVTFDDGSGSSTQSTGSYSRTFASAGTFRYHCSVHGASMSGTVEVK